MGQEIHCDIIYSLSKFVCEVALNIKGELKVTHPNLDRLKSHPSMGIAWLKFDDSVFSDVKRIIELLRKELVSFEIRISKLDYFETGGTIYLRPEADADVNYNKVAIWKRFKNIKKKKRIDGQPVGPGKEHVTICSGANSAIFNEVITKFGINFNSLSEEVTELLFSFKNKDGVPVGTELIKLRNKGDIVNNSSEQQSLFE